MNKFYKTIGFNTVVQIGGKFLSAGLGLFNLGLLTHYLGQSGYGQFALIIAYLGIFSVFSDLGFQLTLTRELARDSVHQEKLLGSYFILKLILVALSVGVALLLLPFFPYSAFLKIAIVIACLGVGLGNINSFGTAIFQSRLRLDLVTYIDVLGKIVTTAFIVLFAAQNFGLYGIVNTILLGNLAASLVTVYLLKNDLHFNRINWPAAKNLLLQSLPVGLILLLSSLYFKVDTIILSFFRGAGEVGIYSLAYKVIENALVLWGFYMATVYPLLAQGKVKNIFRQSFYLALVACLVLVGGGELFAPVIVNLLGGQQFGPSILALRILILALPLLVIDNLFYNNFIANRWSKTPLLALCAALVFNVTINILTIPHWGYLAAAVSTVLTEVIVLTIYAFGFSRSQRH
ncbi:MAG: flippase [Patescibacteria group bacterium]|nr:flippase [Patescibacteria group bacterium]MCL5431752.1 flippase [Patescibacteria group bacterium]